MPEVYELEAERINYAIRLPANQILQHSIGYLLKRPVGRPSNEVRLADELEEKLIKIGAKVVSHGRYVVSKWRRSPSHDKCSRRFCG